MFQQMLAPCTAALSPERFVSAFWAAFPDFAGNAQHDAHEALFGLLDALDHLCVSRHRRRACRFEQPDANLEACGRADDARLATLVFGGVAENEATCLHCAARSLTTEPVLDIAVDVVHPHDDPRSTPAASPRCMERSTGPNGAIFSCADLAGASSTSAPLEGEGLGMRSVARSLLVYAQCHRAVHAAAQHGPIGAASSKPFCIQDKVAMWTHPRRSWSMARQMQPTAAPSDVGLDDEAP